jgi:hypothetical protein
LKYEILKEYTKIKIKSDMLVSSKEKEKRKSK